MRTDGQTHATKLVDLFASLRTRLKKSEDRQTLQNNYEKKLRSTQWYRMLQSHTEFQSFNP